MLKDIKKLPRELQAAYKKVSNRPTTETPESVLNFIDKESSDYGNDFVVNEIVDWVDDTLIDLELDDKLDRPEIYSDFAVQICLKVAGYVDRDKKTYKSLPLYENNEKVTKLKARTFTKLGDMSDLTQLEKANKFAKHYGIQDDEAWEKATTWEKELFAYKVAAKDDTSVEKN